MKIQKKAFTFTELIVSTVIVVLLSSIWFYSYVWYLSEARDWERRADMWVLESALKVYKQNRWAFPLPWDYYNITNNSETNIIAYQWEMNKNVALSNLDKLPFDPFTKWYYTYSTTKTRQEFQVAMSLENWDFPIALVNWNFKTVSPNIVPSIVLAIATGSLNTIEIHDWVTNAWWVWTDNRQKFILDQWENLPYSLGSPFEPVYAYEWVDLWTDVISTWKVDLWVNSDFRTCDEINDSWKYIHDSWTEDYSIRQADWSLTNTWCTIVP